MVKSDVNNMASKEDKEDVTYPGSPRSQVWIGNLFPILDQYNYTYNDIVQLLKACDYNGEKIQNEVDRIMEINVGHEQGEWTVVKQPEKAKMTNGKSGKNSNAGTPKEHGKASVGKDNKQQRTPVAARRSAQQAKADLSGASNTPSAHAAKVNHQSTVKSPSMSAKEQKESLAAKGKQQESSQTRKPLPTKELPKEAPKLQQQSSSKKGFPLQWASLLKTVTTEEEVVANGNGVNADSKTRKMKKGEEYLSESQRKSESPKSKVNASIDAITFAQAEEALKKLEFGGGKKVDRSPAISVSVVEEALPVVMPKPLSTGVDAAMMFGCFDEDIQKPSTWTQTSPVHYHQHPQPRREYTKYSRNAHLRPEATIPRNLLHHETSNMVNHDMGNMHHDQNDALHGDSSHIQENTHDASFQPQWQMGYYGNRYSNTKHQSFSYSYEDEKHKAYRQGGNDHYEKDGHHQMNGLYFNYGYQPDRLQTPPGLVGFYNPQQPFYGFPNTNNQKTHPGASDSMTTSMWRN
ncbi:hypothetical protein BgAZ_502770 [Babesia gibsoni]|uniref:Uncharacterized protein n=1 Tax=Babesia gibsoni TaxID=33632 RepID=A0AAD8P7V9_BABGI|nr:hypothetical protein BgAZ_502770 [Babesia gibsoni]